MKDQLIEFETAVLAKEKGFDWECYNLFELANKDNKHWNINKGDIRRRGSVLSNYNIDSGIGDLATMVFWKYYSQPSQSLLQKWLREKHKLLVEVIPVDSWNEWHVQVRGEDCLAPFCILMNIGENGEFKTYEQALEEGLQEALKLIK